jgi:hypothetical protein
MLSCCWCTMELTHLEELELQLSLLLVSFAVFLLSVIRSASAAGWIVCVFYTQSIKSSALSLTSVPPHKFYRTETMHFLCVESAFFSLSVYVWSCHHMMGSSGLMFISLCPTPSFIVVCFYIYFLFSNSCRVLFTKCVISKIWQQAVKYQLWVQCIRSQI